MDYERVLAEVSAEAEEKRKAGGSVLAFSQVPYEKEKEVSAYTLWMRIHHYAKDFFIPPLYPEESRNPVKRIYSKIVSRIALCVTFPMSRKITTAHQSIRGCMDDMIQVIERQQWEINELTRRIDELENGKKPSGDKGGNAE